MALPTLTVQLDNGGGTFPFDISSKVMAMDGYEISRGRADWQGAVTAGELRLTLNNSDGRFTPGSTTLASPSPIVVDQQIRVKETVNGVVYTRFTGYVKAWPLSWPAVVATFSTVQPDATDAQARAERRTLRSSISEEIMARSPSLYYTLGEATGSTTAGDTSGNQASPLTIVGSGTALTFGTGTGPVDGLPAVQFHNGKYLSNKNDGGRTVATAPSTIAFGCAFNTTDAPGSELIRHNGQVLSLGVAGVLQASGNFFTIVGSRTVNDGTTHVAILNLDGANATVYVDGVADGSDALTGSVVAQDSTDVGDFITATISHVALWPSLSAADAIAITSVGSSESGTARITRLAGYAGIPVGTLDSSLTTVPAQATNDVSAFTAIQEVADAEGGLVFINGSGNLTFHNRDRPRVKTTPDLTLDHQWVTPDVQPVLDDQQLVNYSEATATGTGSTQLVRNSASETTHGRYSDSRAYLVLTDQEALDRANWTVNKLATPVPRYGTLTVNLYGMTASQASTVVAALDLNCWLRVTSMASQTPGGATVDVVVEGWQEQVTAESWTITCNVVAQSLLQAGIYNSATYGVYNTSVYGY